VLPTQSVCLQVPIILPSEHHEEWAVRKREQARRTRTASVDAPHNTQ